LDAGATMRGISKPFDGGHFHPASNLHCSHLWLRLATNVDLAHHPAIPNLNPDMHDVSVCHIPGCSWYHIAWQQLLLLRLEKTALFDRPHACIDHCGLPSVSMWIRRCNTKVSRKGSLTLETPIVAHMRRKMTGCDEEEKVTNHNCTSGQR